MRDAKGLGSGVTREAGLGWWDRLEQILANEDSEGVVKHHGSLSQTRVRPVSASAPLPAEWEHSYIAGKNPGLGPRKPLAGRKPEKLQE